MIAGAVHPRLAAGASPFAGVGSPAEDPRRFVEAWRASVRRLGGTPESERPEAVLCPGCEGRGWVTAEAGNQALCHCDGWGVIRAEPNRCETCQGSGYYRVAGAQPGQQRFGVAFPCPSCAQGNARIRGAGVPPAYRSLDLASYPERCEMTRSRNHALSLGLVLSERGPSAFARANEGRTGLFLHGPAGRTKTGIAVATLAALARRYPRRQMAFVAWPYLLVELKRTFEPGSLLSDEQVLERYALASALVLDDLSPRGAQDDAQSAWRVEVLWRLLETRVAMGAHDHFVTIVTSTLTLDEIAATWDEQVASRLRRLCVPVALDGPDERGRLEPAA